MRRERVLTTSRSIVADGEIRDFVICCFASGCWSVMYLSLLMVIGCFVPVLTNYLPYLLYEGSDSG